MYYEYPPPRYLRDKVKLLYVIDLPGFAEKPSNQLVTPDGCVELNFVTGAPVKRTDVNGNPVIISYPYFISRFREHYYMQRTGPVKIIGISFYAWGWQSFTRLQKLKPDVLHKAAIYFENAELVNAALQNTKDNEECMKLLNKYLVRIFSETDNNILEDACRQLFFDADMHSLDSTCDAHNISRRRLQQVFKQSLGISPKSFSKMVRFQYTLKLLREHHFEKLSDVAYSAGYNDQSHFIKDFKLFSGLNPNNYLKQNTVLNDITSAAAFLSNG